MRPGRAGAVTLPVHARGHEAPPGPKAAAKWHNRPTAFASKRSQGRGNNPPLANASPISASRAGEKDHASYRRCRRRQTRDERGLDAKIESEAVPRLCPGSALEAPQTRVAFRFVFIYFILYCLPSPLSFFSERPDFWYGAFWDKVVKWVSVHILGITLTALPARRGSGDTTAAYIQVLCYLALATVGATIWTLLDRRRPNYQQLYQWLELYVRTSLAAILTVYGAMESRALPHQPACLTRLLEPYGDSSPMGLLWTFMGASKGYSIFCGGVEMLAAILLFVPGCATRERWLPWAPWPTFSC